jgi:hypothetical protein
VPSIGVPPAARHLSTALEPMKEAVSVLLAISAVVAASPAFAQRSAAADTACYKASSHADAQTCLERRADASARRVRAAEQLFREALAKTDQEPGDIAAALAAFEAASKEYWQFRNILCEVPAKLAFGGNAASDRRYLCQIEMDERRARDIERDQTTGL